AKQPPDHSGFSMLGGGSEKVIVVEFEVDDFTVAVDGHASDVVSEVPVPADTRSLRIGNHVALVAPISFLLPFSSRIIAERTELVAVPEAMNQFHKQMTIDAMALLDGLVGKLRRVLGQVDLDNVTELLLPVGRERPLVLEARRWCA